MSMSCELWATDPEAGAPLQETMPSVCEKQPVAKTLSNGVGLFGTVAIDV